VYQLCVSDILIAVVRKWIDIVRLRWCGNGVFTPEPNPDALRKKDSLFLERAIW
jgi:hypothetical protein